jgi:hypothetical protein
LLALKSYTVSSRIVLQCGDSLLALSNRVRRVWVPGHRGIHENEGPMHLQERDQVLLLWGRGLVFRWHLRVSSARSKSGYTCRQSGLWLKKPNSGLTRYLLRLPRSKLRILVGLITGHCPLNKHLHNIGLIDKPICIACGMEDESAFHLLCDCPCVISLRMRTFSKLILSVEEYEGRLHLHCCDSCWQVADSL